MSGTDASISMTTAGRRFSRTVSAVDSMRSSSSTTRRSSGQAGRCSRGVCGRGSRGGCSCDSRGACSCAIPGACEGIGVGTDPPPSAARRACPPAAPHRRLAHRRLEPPAMVRGIGARARRHPNGELRPERVAARRVAATASRGRASGRPRRLRRPRPLACCGRGRGRAPDPSPRPDRLLRPDTSCKRCPDEGGADDPRVSGRWPRRPDVDTRRPHRYPRLTQS